MSKNETPKYMRMKELSTYLRVSPATLYRYIQKGLFRGKKLSAGTTIYNREEVEKALNLC